LWYEILNGRAIARLFPGAPEKTPDLFSPSSFPEAKAGN
jgi:hypothetical protein